MQKSHRSRSIGKGLVVAGACVLLVQSCAGLRPPPEVEPITGAPASWDTAWEGAGAQASTPVETGVVVAPERGVVGSLETPAHEVQSDGGRMYILELYQQAMEEKDGLIQHVRVLESEREKMQKMLAQAEERIRELEAQVASSIASEADLRARVDELAGRLLTAQIRRLEAEKILLEAKLEAASEPSLDLASQEPAARRP
jgi:hypothetical protein